jgi:uncharacterized protein (DUF1330 family)
MKIIGLVKVLDPAAFEDYRSQVGATVALYGGEIVLRGKVSKIAWNELDCESFEAIVELSFPSDTRCKRLDDKPGICSALKRSIKGNAVNAL